MANVPCVDHALLDIATECDLSPSSLRSIVCRILRERPDPSNWSEYPNIWEEVQSLVDRCDWYRAYDIVEAISASLLKYPGPHWAVKFESSINECFREMGIGWQLAGGFLRTRGEDAFETTVADASMRLEEASFPTAKSELAEAIRDLSRRPEPDLSGAVHHAMAALECVAREVSGDPKRTLGDILKSHPDLIPKPLDDSVSKAWGFASETARHAREGRDLRREEAELVVGLAAVVSTYLIQKSHE